MIGVKTGTQTWSNSQQRTDFKSDGTQTVSASDRQNHMGDENIGEILNKVADPGYVDKSKQLRTVGDNQLNKDAFMSLLLTQMKNQDPTSPLKSHEMAAQLAQFTSLEKLHNINESVDGLRKDQQPNHNFQALAMIGRVISTDNSKISRADTASTHEVGFQLPADAQSVTLSIQDADGVTVRKIEQRNMKAGKNLIGWNGLTDDGRRAATGEYVAVLEATSSNGRKLGVETKTEGVITGVNFTPKGPQLLIGKQAVNMSEVKSISDPELLRANELKVQAAAQPPIPVGATASKGPIAIKAETKDNAEKAAKLGKGNLADAAMAQDFINKLNKEGAKAGGM